MKVIAYDSYRPSYPVETLHALKMDCQLDILTSIADIGSGTGFFTELLLNEGYNVYGVEPDDEMRGLAERKLDGFSTFHSVKGEAEKTNLSDDCVSLVIAASSFQWFHPDLARSEFLRILKVPRWVALIWNFRATDTSAFAIEYEELCHSYMKPKIGPNQHEIDQILVPYFFQSRQYTTSIYQNPLICDLSRFVGLFFSSSYAPDGADTRYENIENEIKRIFYRYEAQGVVQMDYQTVMYLGQL